MIIRIKNKNMKIKPLPTSVGAQYSAKPDAFPYRLFDGDSFVWIGDSTDMNAEGVYLFLYDQYAVLQRFDERRKIDCRV